MSKRILFELKRSFLFRAVLLGVAFLVMFHASVFFPSKCEAGVAGDGSLIPAMSCDDRKIFYRYLGAAKRYIEFGSGGSTYQAALRPNIQEIVVVEADSAWVQQLSTYDAVQKAIQAGRLQMNFINISSAPGDWSFPADESRKEHWPEYAGMIERFPVNHFDTVLVDGRFRVYVALLVHKFISRDAALLIHDYGERRSARKFLIRKFGNNTGYGAVEQFYDVIETGTSLFVFRKKEGVDVPEDTLSMYKWQPA